MKKNTLVYLFKRLFFGLLIVIGSPALPLYANSPSDLPALGDRASATVSLDQEYKMGRAWLKALRSQTTEIDNPLIYDFIEHLLYRLAENSELKDRRLELVVVDSPALNAFAVPGGIVGVNGGLFLYAQTEQEFAAVLAHELAHLSQRHYSRAVETAQRNHLPNMAALLGSIIVAATVGGDAGMAAISATQAAMLDQQLRFSRENEQEADRVGFQTLVNAGMDPQAMASMFQRMLVAQRLAGSRPPEFLLTHPVTDSRVADARNRADQVPRRGTLPDDSLEYHLMRNRMRLAFDDSPAHAISLFKAELENNDALIKSAAQYGLALAYAKAGQDDQANRILKQLLDSEPNRISYIAAYAQINSNPQKQAEVEDMLNKQLILNPNNYALSMALSQCLILQKNYPAAQNLLKKISQQRPGIPAVWLKLAEAYGYNQDSIGVHLASAEYFILRGNLDQAQQQLEYAYQKSDKNFQLTTRIEQRQQDITDYQEELKQF